jgi:hypothetical protein
VRAIHGNGAGRPAPIAVADRNAASERSRFMPPVVRLEPIGSQMRCSIFSIEV